MPFYKSMIDTSWLDPERASVFDPLYKRVTRKVANLMGYEGKPEEMVQIPSPATAAVGVATSVAKKVAPKRAAKELADVLMGRSSRVPPATVYDKLPEADASLRAMMESTIHGNRPPKPVVIRMGSGTGLTIPGKTQVARAPELTENYKIWQRALQHNPEAVTPKTITGYGVQQPIQKAIKDVHIGDGMREVAKQGGSVQKAAGPLKIMTEKEIKALIDGPRKAMQLGGLTAEQGKAVLIRNKQKIDDYFAQLQKLEHAKYDQQMKDRIEAHYMGNGPMDRNSFNPNAIRR